MLINPLIAGPAADPWMIFHDGAYYFCESRKSRTIHVRKAKHFLDIGQDNGVQVWAPPQRGMNSRSIWAPELHFIDGRWFIYYAADNGKNANHRMWVLESRTSDPQGEYICRGCLETDGWAIDGTPFLADDGQLYFIWSGWPGKVDGKQNLYIAPMSNPYTLSSKRVLISEPTESWERFEMAINEGPQVLRRDGKLFIIYSASASWTMHYCLGMLELTGSNLLDATSWKKVGPVFEKNELFWGVGHCSFVKSPCQMEDWILFHAKTDKSDGWLDRRVHAQRFEWDLNGRPNFGRPTGFLPARADKMAA
ncbi:MAG: glycoside hydrolase family 43 protein [Verrucomicrobia bacterium]|nr:glycoside hydrolase family 43 protein [Verrucomicrobiota bacterium]